MQIGVIQNIQHLYQKLLWSVVFCVFDIDVFSKFQNSPVAGLLAWILLSDSSISPWIVNSLQKKKKRKAFPTFCLFCQSFFSSALILLSFTFSKSFALRQVDRRRKLELQLRVKSSPRNKCESTFSNEIKYSTFNSLDGLDREK